MTRLASNATALQSELAWFELILNQRLSAAPSATIFELAEHAPAPELSASSSIYASFICHYEMTLAERIIVLLALIPHIKPQLLDVFFNVDENAHSKHGHTEYGGLEGRMHGGFLPTGETALFLISGTDLAARFEYLGLFERQHFFAQHNLLRLELPPAGEPPLCGQLCMTDEMVDYLTRGELRKPDYSRNFPARLINTEMEWSDLVLSPVTAEQLKELIMWMQHQQTLMQEWGLEKRLKPGYKSLFYGPPGTGKTLTATLLGKKLEKDVYRIALSAVVSKYIGETEKNLDKVFDTAENMDCILFFDEADALFGKRTSVTGAHDRYANQEVSYLLQRIEEFPRLVILASNFVDNIDDAFMRRFQAVVYFPMPTVTEREALWHGAFAMLPQLSKDFDIQDLASRYELAGGSIMNVVRYACLHAIEGKRQCLRHSDIVTGIRRELHKEGKTL